jgi:hypothetical protein
MCDIVEIQAFSSKRRAKSGGVPPQGAEILLFLGIRYERHETVQAAPEPGRKRRARKNAPSRKRAAGAAPAKRKTGRKRA